MDQRRLAAWAGIIGPILFVLVFTLEGAFRPGYDPLRMFVSELSLGPRGWVQMANFIVFGVFLLTFARGVATEFGGVKGSRAGVVLLTLVAAGYFASGPLVMDPPGTPPSQASLHGTLHGLIGGIVFLLMPTCCFVFLRVFRRNPLWHSFYGWTLALGIMTALAVILLTVASKVPNAQDVFRGWLGLIQRFLIVPFMLWVFLFGVRLLRRG